MKISITKEQLESILTNYYKTYEERDVIVVAKAIQGCTGYYEEPCTIVKISAITQMNILGEKVVSEEEISDAQLRNILQTLLEEQGYSVEGGSYDAGIDVDDRFQHKAAYFHGIVIEVQQKKEQKVKMIV